MIRLRGQAKDAFRDLPSTTATDALPLTLTPLDPTRHQCPLRIAQQAMFEMSEDLVHVPCRKLEIWRLYPNAYDPRLVKLEIMALALGSPPARGRGAVELLLGN